MWYTIKKQGELESIMLKIRIDLPFGFYDEGEYNNGTAVIIERFGGKSFQWRLFERDITFSSTIVSRPIFETNDSIIIDNYKRYLAIHPENEEIREKLEKKENEHRCWWSVVLSLEGELDAETSIEDNTLFFPDMKRYSIEDVVEKDLCSYFLSYHLDDQLFEQLRQQIMGFSIALMLSTSHIWDYFTGSFSVFLNNVFYKKDLVFDWQGWSDEVPETTISTSQLEITDCWNWIRKNTSIMGERPRSPIYFTSLSYVLNRQGYEALLFAVLGLESLFVKPNSKNISYQFQRNLKAVFPSLSDVDLKKIYGMRSKFVHGETEFSILDSFLELERDNSLNNALELLVMLLVESIRILIKNDAIRFHFQETVTYQFE